MWSCIVIPRRFLLILAISLATATTVAAAGQGEAPLTEESAAPIDVAVEVLKGPTGMGMIRLMDEEPSFGDSVSVDYAVSGAPDVLVSKVLSGEVDIAALPSNVAAKLYNSGVPYQLAAVNTLGVLYLVSNDAEVGSFSELRGARIDTSARGANPDIILRHLLSEHEIDPEEDVELRYYNHTELAQLVISGRSDLAVLPEPFVTRVIGASETARVEIDLQEVWRDLKGEDEFIAMGVLVVKNSLVEERPEFVEEFLEGYEASIDWVNANPRAAGRLIERNELGFTAASAAEAIPRASIRYIGAAEARQRLEAYFSVLLDFDPASIGGALPDDGFYLEL
ncbi:MAG: ABC transporter substrate-binding protein [Spirochaetes bacterium]|jgi:NitT/TauT family transport system substrate-binding protein|nr:ABC transporter substrate-binding protein [Spirochaetota bacterium]